MNNKANSFYCKLVFELNSKEYTIERKGIKQKLGNVKVNVDFYYVDDLGQTVSLNGKDRSDTNANIRAIVGNYEDSILTTLSIQNNNTGFIDMSQSDRKDLLAQFLDINIYEDLYNLANNNSKEIYVLFKEYQKIDKYMVWKS
jgi:DNA repair exonuclease SbcCD ATPase subunit